MSILGLGKPRPPVPAEPASPARIRAPFRVLAVLAAPVMIAGPIAMVWRTLLAIAHGNWSDAVMCLGFVAPFGFAYASVWKVVRAGLSGHDPYSEDRLMEEAASRAMLEAVERTGSQPGPPGLFGPG